MRFSDDPYISLCFDRVGPVRDCLYVDDVEDIAKLIHRQRVIIATQVLEEAIRYIVFPLAVVVVLVALLRILCKAFSFIRVNHGRQTPACGKCGVVQPQALPRRRAQRQPPRPVERDLIDFDGPVFLPLGTVNLVNFDGQAPMFMLEHAPPVPLPPPPRPRIYFAPHRTLRPAEVDELLAEGWIVADWNAENQELRIFDGVRPKIIVWPRKIYWDQALKLRALVANQVSIQKRPVTFLDVGTRQFSALSVLSF